MVDEEMFTEGVNKTKVIDEEEIKLNIFSVGDIYYNLVEGYSIQWRATEPNLLEEINDKDEWRLRSVRDRSLYSKMFSITI